MGDRVKVLLVDDSPLALKVLERLIQTDPGLEVVGKARDGREALELIPKVDPAVVCTDLEMPRMDGLEFTREVMDRLLRPILVVTSSQSGQPIRSFELMEAGALDVFRKPGDLEGASASDLTHRIRILSGVKVFRRPRPVRPPAAAAAAPPESIPADVAIIAMGASTGGPAVFRTLFEHLRRADTPPILCVQHISPGFLSGMVTWLQNDSPLRIQVAESGQRALPGHVYFAPDDLHLTIDNGGILRCTAHPARDVHRPSVDVLFDSVARVYGKRAVGVLLTGMGSDGARGLAEIARQGGVTMAQDEASSVVFGMPRQAIELGAAWRVADPENIGRILQDLIRRPGGA